ncbi:hypothetical protein D9M72_654020 [compost metagenome]
MGDAMPFKITQFFIGRFRTHDRDQPIAAHLIASAFGGKRNSTCAIDRLNCRPCRKARKMQTS